MLHRPLTSDTDPATERDHLLSTRFRPQAEAALRTGGQDGQPVDESPIKEALHKLTIAVEQTFSALGNATGDDAVREDARNVGLGLRDALESSLFRLGEQFRSSNKKD